MGTFGQRLKDLRNTRGISQNELSKHIGVSKSSVNMYERDEREPGFETLEAIADFFNVNMDYLLGRDPHINVITNSQEIVINAQVSEGLFSTSAKPTLIKFVAAMNSTNSPDFLEYLARVRKEMDETFSASDFEHLTEFLIAINAAYEQALNLIARNKDSTLTADDQAAPAPQDSKDTIPDRESSEGV